MGIKLVLGRKSEFIVMCKVMVEKDVMLDFIMVDGGEGGIGVVLFEYINFIGFFLCEVLVFVDDCFIGFGICDKIKIIVFGKIIIVF